MIKETWNKVYIVPNFRYAERVTRSFRLRMIFGKLAVNNHKIQLAESFRAWARQLSGATR